MNKILLTICFIAIGCGGNVIENMPDDNNTAGNANTVTVTSAVPNLSILPSEIPPLILPQNTGGEGGNEANPVTSQSGASNPQAGNSNVAGTDNAGGMPAIISPPNAGSNSEVCVSKTCDDVALEQVGGWNTYDNVSAPMACGWVSDGCGNTMDCGECPSDGSTGAGCSEGVTLGSTKMYYVEPVDYICGNRCIKEHFDGSEYICESLNKEFWACQTTIPPLGKLNCEPATLGDDVTYKGWCCEPS